MAIFLLVSVIAYLLGSIPCGFILARVFLDTDVRKIGSGNIGATNVLRTGSKKLGLATLLLDAGKGYAAVYVAALIAFSGHRAASWPRSGLLVASAALCAILGHMFPVWLKFKGGKGVATGVGVFLALGSPLPKAVLIVLGLFTVIFACFRYVSLASIIATAAFPVVAFALMPAQERPLLPFLCAASLLIIAKHHENIRRLLSGTEHRFEFTRK